MREINYCDKCGGIYDPTGFWRDLLNERLSLKVKLTLTEWEGLADSHYCDCEEAKRRSVEVGR